MDMSPNEKVKSFYNVNFKKDQKVVIRSFFRINLEVS